MSENQIFGDQRINHPCTSRVLEVCGCPTINTTVASKLVLDRELYRL